MADRHEPLTSECVKHVFKGLEEVKGADFLHYVSESVDWTIKGTHNLAGRYTSRQAFQVRHPLHNCTDSYHINVLQSMKLARLSIHSQRDLRG